MIKVVAYLALFFLFIIFYTGYSEYRSTYFPTRDINSTPRDIGLEFKDTYFASSHGVVLNAWFIPASGNKTILFCHGNGGNISHRLEKIKILHDLGLNVFIFDYRGYGKSKGRPTEAGLYRDTRAAYDYMVEKKKMPTEKIILYGESLGGAVAIELATKVTLGALITEETFLSARDIAKTIAPFLWYFIPKSRYNSTSKIANITCPKLIMHSIDDEIVDFSHGEKLFARAAHPKEFVKLRGSHNTAYFDSGEVYKEAIKAFLEKYK